MNIELFEIFKRRKSELYRSLVRTGRSMGWLIVERERGKRRRGRKKKKKVEG